MDGIKVQAAAEILASAGEVYAVLADYREGHPAILPEQYFASFQVLEGGVGAGTRLELEMRALGTRRVSRQVVSEPEPGRVLVETDEDGAAETTFTVDSMPGGSSARVTIQTRVRAASGLRGWFERLLTPPFLRRVYRAELEKLAEYVQRERNIA